MGYIFGICIDCGVDQSVALDIARSFSGKMWRLSNEVVVRSPRAQDIVEFSRGVWRCDVIPDGVSATGQPLLVKGTAARIELTRVLYDQLRQCDGYRFACAGWEVFGDLSVEDIIDSKNDLSRLRPGLVVNRDLWLQLGSPVAFARFGPGTFWNNPDENGFDELARFNSKAGGLPDY